MLVWLRSVGLRVKVGESDNWAWGNGANAERYEAAGDRFGFAAQLAMQTVAPGCRGVWNQYAVRVVSGDGTSQRREELQPREIRHHDVAHDQIEALAREQPREGLSRLRGRRDLVLGAQHAGRDAKDRVVVVDEEDPMARAAGARHRPWRG